MPKPNPIILCFGDSWTYGNYQGLQQHLQKKQLKVPIHRGGQYGTTARQYANHQEELPRWVSQTRATHVLLSLGGNDLKNFYFREGRYTSLPSTATTLIKKDLNTILDALYLQHPNVKVVMYGYDFLGSAEEFIINDKAPRSGLYRTLYRWIGIPITNMVASSLSKTLSSLEKEYTQKGHHFTYVPLWGTLQHVIEEEEEDDKKRGYSYWKHSATEYMQDPIHANSKGFSVLMGKLYKEYFVRELETQQQDGGELKT
ncbi:hypothetical protein PROFUN_14097 [Planoprotostelium fungivorum]|uniref:Uncharacterized protein n=1 Tax=Planoprotostelium fungivorum TaxID=1890364 RepID=A0A2P6N1Z3_9EUKA|nr:hypothetical protein PROFUN_14097 [Planoprotostelium fungivorum]